MIPSHRMLSPRPHWDLGDQKVKGYLSAGLFYWANANNEIYVLLNSKKKSKGDITLTWLGWSYNNTRDWSFNTSTNAKQPLSWGLMGRFGGLISLIYLTIGPCVKNVILNVFSPFFQCWSNSLFAQVLVMLELVYVRCNVNLVHIWVLRKLINKCSV